MSLSTDFTCSFTPDRAYPVSNDNLRRSQLGTRAYYHANAEAFRRWAGLDLIEPERQRCERTALAFDLLANRTAVGLFGV